MVPIHASAIVIMSWAGEPKTFAHTQLPTQPASQGFSSLDSLGWAQANLSFEAETRFPPRYRLFGRAMLPVSVMSHARNNGLSLAKLRPKLLLLHWAHAKVGLNWAAGSFSVVNGEDGVFIPSDDGQVEQAEEAQTDR